MAKRMTGRFILLVMLTLVAGHSLRSQVLLIPEVQNGGAVFRQQLWSLVINNMTGQVQKGVLNVTVADKNTAQLLLDANSGMIILNPGVKRVMYNDLSPVNYSVAAAGFGMDNRINQPMPVGEYLVCYKLVDPDKNTVLASECVKLVAEPLSPPQLVQPENESVVTDPRPVLTWTPPAPVYMFSSLSYDIVVSQLYENQSPEEALQRNIPVMTTMSANNSILYPSTFTDLQPGKTYVWQVAAKDAGRYAGKSEVFRFTVVPDSIKSIIESASYAKIQHNSSEITYLQQGVLKIDYVNHAGDNTIKAVITDMTEQKSKPVTVEFNLTPGQNMLRKDMNSVGRFDSEHVYKVTLTNSKNESVSFRFSAKYYF